jgi:hypothetical protein
MTFRMYFNGAEFDKELPPSAPIKDVVVPVKKPHSAETTYMLHLADGEDAPPGVLEARRHAAETRRGMLKEVRLHMDLLKDFEGVIPQAELDARKRQLYLAMPDAPPSAGKRHKRFDDDSSDDGV